MNNSQIICCLGNSYRVIPSLKNLPWLSVPFYVELPPAFSSPMCLLPGLCHQDSLTSSTRTDSLLHPRIRLRSCLHLAHSHSHLCCPPTCSYESQVLTFKKQIQSSSVEHHPGVMGRTDLSIVGTAWTVFTSCQVIL